MDDELRASISISVLDKYLEASSFTEDRDGYLYCNINKKKYNNIL